MGETRLAGGWKSGWTMKQQVSGGDGAGTSLEGNGRYAGLACQKGGQHEH